MKKNITAAIIYDPGDTSVGIPSTYFELSNGNKNGFLLDPGCFGDIEGFVESFRKELLELAQGYLVDNANAKVFLKGWDPDLAEEKEV